MSIYKEKYRHILILESRAWWGSCREQFEPSSDLVLTYDFALKREVELMGGQALYIDHLVDQQVMQENNFLIYRFFKDWHFDAEGNDIFIYKRVPFGFAFRLEIWNDFTFYVRNRICLEKLRELSFEAIIVATSLGIVEDILEEMKLPFIAVEQNPATCSTYFFPIFKCMDERLRTRLLKHLIRDVVTVALGTIMGWVDRISGTLDKPAVFIQEYHPTRALLQSLKKDDRLRLVLAHYSWSRSLKKLLTERPIPVWSNLKHCQKEAERLIYRFRTDRCARMILTNQIDITAAIYKIIEDRISDRIGEYLSAVDCVTRFLDKSPIKLAILIANIGQIATIVDCLCRTRRIPSYLIINGYMSGDFVDESKYATFINSYSTSIKEDYYRGMDNVVCLGDPRMDDYVRDLRLNKINRDTPTITIGPAAHSIVDLNSYLAVEFEFMYDILKAINIFKKQGAKLKVVIKVRATSYLRQYQDFTNEYFPDLVDELIQNAPMQSVLKKTDFYISTYSQSLIEASCLGIPVLYYKNDREIIGPPFDGKSELVTANNVDDIVQAISDFLTGSERFESFLKKEVLEKYIGPLDGKNTQRNLDFINSLIFNNLYGDRTK